ncbi:putative Ig domain-containing protein [Actinoplanes sp. NPDC051494]|uniref:putative Ig domain-containing protein n=1 Tax=Actinoplanes sp. NPDC051494 TaxID=3363907 RepID=UPI00379B2590
MRLWRRRGDDEGFTLIEVLVSMAVIGTVMAAAAPFMVKSLTESNQQRTDQVGIQVATDALERARALDPASLLSGRGLAEATRQKNAAPADVKAYYDHMEVAADPMLANTSTEGQNAPLPTVPLVTSSNGVSYKQEWYVGKCWQSKATAALTVLGGCENRDTTAKAALYTVPFFQVVAVVSWTGNTCTDKTCRFITSTLISNSNDPVFDIKTAPPTIVAPLPLTSYTGTPVNLQVLSTGGKLPLTWTATNLPPGVTFSADGGKFTGTPTTAGTYKVTIKVAGRDKLSDTKSFTWTIVQPPPPVLTTPGDQTSRTGTLLSLQPAITGGTAPMVWTATNLPAGLVIDAATGLITGTPTTVRTATTTITVTDVYARKSTVSFSWRVLSPVQLYNVPAQSMTNGTNIGTFTPYAYGGVTPYTWKATGLPDGATMDAATGKVTGVITHGTRYITTVTVTDAAGGAATMTVVCTVNPSGTTDLRVTSPSPSTPDQSSSVNSPITPVTATALGATPASYKWTATNLPTGLTMSTAGVVSGTPTVPGTYVVTFVVKSTGTTQANLMFTWSVA